MRLRDGCMGTTPVPTLSSGPQVAMTGMPIAAVNRRTCCQHRQQAKQAKSNSKIGGYEMLLQIGYAKSGVAIETLDNGSVWSNRGRIAGFGGWMRLESSATDTLRGAPAKFAMQIRSANDPHGIPFIVVEQIEVEGHRYDDLAALALALCGDIAWLGYLVASVHREIDIAIEIRRLQSGLGAVVPVPIEAAGANDTRRLCPIV